MSDFLYGLLIILIIYFLVRFVKLFLSDAKVIDETKNIVEYVDDGITYRSKVRGNLKGLKTIRIRDYALSFFSRWMFFGALKCASIVSVFYFYYEMIRMAMRV